MKFPSQVNLDRSGKRLDWILLSGELSFHSYRVMSDVLSDHHGVVAEVVHNPQSVSLRSDHEILRKHD